MWSGRMPRWSFAKASGTAAPPSPRFVYPIARLTGRFQPRKRRLSRGHLSRPACSHVKQVAKRPGTRGPGGMISGRVFCWAKEALMSASQSRRYRPETRLVHSASLRSQFGETSEALFLAQGYVYDNSLTAERRFKNEEPGYQYSRFSNPTVTMFEQRMAALEGAEAARATATGMAAVTTAVMGQLRAGDHVVAAKALFGSCRYVVEEHCNRYGIASTLVDGTDLAQWKNAVRPNTKTFFLESPTNPTLEVLDIKAIAEIAHAAGATLIVDNVFAT